MGTVLRIVAGGAAERLVERLAARGMQSTAVESQVRRIVDDVRRNGDRALRRYAERWDGLKRNQPLRVSEAEMKTAWQDSSPQLRKSLHKAASNIRQFCRWQKPRSWTRIRAGISLGQIFQPLESAGCYIPRGRYPLVSTVLMTVIPAQVAGVKNIRITSPKPSPEMLAAATMLGVSEFYRVGGAQAVAALAYGTESIPRVNKIVGPGNSYVTVAKKLIAFDCAIDFLAGPTEALILSESGNPDFIAADLVAQAEHDVEAMSLFITTSRTLAKFVARSAARLSSENSTAQASLRRNGAILIAASSKQVRDWANLIAPEHITVEKRDVSFIQNAGSIFVGDYSAQAAGDYASGPNHVLPTAGQARFRGGLSVFDFVKVITVQQLSRRGLRTIAPTVESLAAAEGLRGHAQSIRARCAHA